MIFLPHLPIAFLCLPLQPPAWCVGPLTAPPPPSIPISVVGAETVIFDESARRGDKTRNQGFARGKEATFLGANWFGVCLGFPPLSFVQQKEKRGGC